MEPSPSPPPLPLRLQARRRAPWIIALWLVTLLAIAFGVRQVVLPRFRSTPRLDAAAPLTSAEVQRRVDAEVGPYGLTRLHRFHFTIPASEWQALEETHVERGRGGGASGFVEEGETDFVREDGRLIHRGGGFGGYFPWARADFQAGELAVAGIGLRYKGNSSYTNSANQLRRNLKVKLDLHGAAGTLDGQKTLNLHAGAVDGSRIRESLSYAVFRAARVPAPRTAFAEVRITVPGLHDSEYAGVYTLIENVGKPFLKDVLPPGTGLLMKPERATGGITYIDEAWSSYPPVYRPEREATPEEQRRVIEFARLVNQGTDAEFRARIASFVDIEAFLRFVAAHALLVNLDSFLGGRHNFYLYLDPRDDRFRFIPWDQDLSLGSFGGRTRGSSGDILDLSLAHPYSGQNPLISRVLAQPAYEERYRAILREVTATVFNRPALRDLIDRIEDTIKEPLERERIASLARGEAGGGASFGRGRPPRAFVDMRTQFVTEQLAGRSEGVQPGGGRGGR